MKTEKNTVTQIVKQTSGKNILKIGTNVLFKQLDNQQVELMDCYEGWELDKSEGDAEAIRTDDLSTILQTNRRVASFMIGIDRMLNNFKSNVTVGFGTKHHVSKVIKRLQDFFCSPLNQELIFRTEHEIISVVKYSSFQIEKRTNLIPRDSNPPHLFELLKIDKPRNG